MCVCRIAFVLPENSFYSFLKATAAISHQILRISNKNKNVCFNGRQILSLHRNYFSGKQSPHMKSFSFLFMKSVCGRLIHTASLPWLQGKLLTICWDISSHWRFHLVMTLLLEGQGNRVGKWCFHSEHGTPCKLCMLHDGERVFGRLVICWFPAGLLRTILLQQHNSAVMVSISFFLFLFAAQGNKTTPSNQIVFDSMVLVEGIT